MYVCHAIILLCEKICTSTQPLNKVGLYTGPASISVNNFHSGFPRVHFYAVYSSKLEKYIIAFSLGHNRDQCYCEAMTSTELSNCYAYTWLTVIKWVGPGLNSRPGLYLLKDVIKWNWLLFEGNLYLRKYGMSLQQQNIFQHGPPMIHDITNQHVHTQIQY